MENNKEILIKLLEEAQNNRELLTNNYKNNLKEINEQIQIYLKKIENLITLEYAK